MFHEFLFWCIQENILYLKVMWYSSQYLIKFPICWTFKITDPRSFLLYKRNSALLKSIHYGRDYFYFKGNHLLSWHRRDSCIQWCLEWAVVWIEVTSEGVLPQASSTHSLSGRTGALLVDGMMLTSSVWGKDVWFQLNFVCVCVEKEPMIFFKRPRNLACVLSMDYFTTVCCCCSSMDSNLCEPMQDAKSSFCSQKKLLCEVGD